MNPKTQCPNCLKNFSSPQRLISHLNRKISCQQQPPRISIKKDDLKDLSEKNYICQNKGKPLLNPFKQLEYIRGVQKGFPFIKGTTSCQ